MKKSEQELTGLLIVLAGLFCFIVALLQVEEYVNTSDHLMVLFSVSVMVIGAIIIKRA